MAHPILRSYLYAVWDQESWLFGYRERNIGFLTVGVVVLSWSGGKDVSVWRTEGGPHNSHIENSSDFVWYSRIILSKKKGLIEILS